MPVEKYRVNRKKPTGGIVLAAGLSTRFGKPKQLADLGGKPLLQWVVDACLGSRLGRVVVVIGRNASRVASLLSAEYSDPRLGTVVNRRYRQGMSSSLRSGLAKIRQDCPSAMFLLGDQPLVTAELIDDLLDRFWNSDKDICAPLHENRRANPTLFSSRFYPQLSAVSGDVGAREIIRTHSDALLTVEVADPLPFWDIDTETDLKALIGVLKTR